ncbi:MAG TPA: MMPL family transporter [Chitinophagaceae bacterium]|nr:MMPL family transporter [Chitinophagaceae bacterium]
MEKIKSQLIIFILLLLTVFSFISHSFLKFEFNIEKLFPHDDEDLPYFQQFQQRFHSERDDEFILIGLKNKTGIFRKEFLEKADSLTRFISKLENIIKVYSLTTTNLLYFKNEEINARPLLHISQPEKYKEDSVYLFESKEYRDLLVSKDGKSIAIAAFNKQFLTDDQKDFILNSIQNKINQLDFDEFHVAAKIRIERIYIKEIEKNLKIYLVVSLTLISIVLFILFKSVRSIITPLFIIGASISWTLSFIALTGHSLDIISSLLPPILAAICMSDVVHISTHYIENLRSGLSKQEALKKTYQEIGVATFYTCCTVAAGFFTLGITDIIPIRNFGFFAGIGLFMAFGITMFALYAYYTLSPIPSVVYEKKTEYRWNNFLAFSFKTVVKNKYLVLAVFVVIAFISVYYINKIEINSSLLQEIPRRNPVLDDYKFMETDFAGTRPFELELEATGKNNTFLDLQKLRMTEEIENFLIDSCGVGNLISPLSLFRGANKTFYGGDNIHFKLPENQQQVNRFYEAIFQTEYADEMQRYLSEDGSRLRISGRLPNLDLKQFKKLEDKFQVFFRAKNYNSSFSYRFTGSAVLLDKATYSLTKNLFTGIIIDAVVISIIALLLLRYWRIIFIVLIPNVIPLLIMGAAMGLLGINLKADTSVIFAIAFGIAVDDTIHFLSRFRFELSKGLSVPYAIKRTYLSTGKAIIVTTLVLLSGFMALLSSSFGGAFYIGLLISLCLFTALIMELTITPILILLFYKKNRKSRA